MYPAGTLKRDDSTGADEKPVVCVVDSMSTLCAGVAGWPDAGCSGGGSFFFLPKLPNPPSLLAIAEDALCLATSPALGITGPFEAGKGASYAAGSGSHL